MPPATTKAAVDHPDPEAGEVDLGAGTRLQEVRLRGTGAHYLSRLSRDSDRTCNTSRAVCVIKHRSLAAWFTG